MGSGGDVFAVDAHDFIRNGGVESTLVVVIYPGKLSVRVELQELQALRGAHEIQTRKGESGFLHHGDDALLLITAQLAGLPGVGSVEGADAGIHCAGLAG